MKHRISQETLPGKVTRGYLINGQIRECQLAELIWGDDSNTWMNSTERTLNTLRHLVFQFRRIFILDRSC